MTEISSFEQFQPCGDCTDPENFRSYLTALDMVADYRPSSDLLIESTALYFAIDGHVDPASQAPIETAQTDQKKAAILEVATETAKTVSKLDDIRGRLATRLTRVDCAVFCGGAIRNCPKVKFAVLAVRQST